MQYATVSSQKNNSNNFSAYKALQYKYKNHTGNHIVLLQRRGVYAI